MLAAVQALWLCGSAFAADLPPPRQPEPRPQPAQALSTLDASLFYVGGAFSWVHHTGYLPDAQLNVTQWNVGRYAPGGKVFGGYRFNNNIQFELAYHYLGAATFISGFPGPGLIEDRERAQAVAASVIYVSPPLSSWMRSTPVPLYLNLRLGLAYKDVVQTSDIGSAHEGFLAGVVGAALEYRFATRYFARIEYEFISTAIGGPPERIPALRGLFPATFGGTRHVVNVMNTPLSISAGVTF